MGDDDTALLAQHGFPRRRKPMLNMLWPGAATDPLDIIFHR